MSQQVYQRRFAMLRPFQNNQSPMAGYARFDLHGGHGHMTVNVQGFAKQNQPFHAVLIGGEEAHAVYSDCGRLTLTESGQGNLFCELDAAVLRHQPFEQWHTCLIVAPDQPEIILLCGFFGKCADPDWSKRVLEVKQLFQNSGEPVPVFPVSDGVISEPESSPQDKEAFEPSAQNDSPASSDSVSPLMLSSKNIQTVSGQSEQIKSQNEADIPFMEAQWQGHAYGLRGMFEKYPTESVFSARDDVMFVRVPMTVEPQLDHYLLGAHRTENVIDAVCVAIPGEYAPHAPAGLMGASFARTDSEKGYWFSWQDGYTGRPMEIRWPWQNETETNMS